MSPPIPTGSRFVQIAAASVNLPDARNDWDVLVVALDEQGRVWWRWHMADKETDWSDYPLPPGKSRLTDPP